MAKGYMVTDVGERERYSAQGRRVLYYDVSIVTDSGATGTLRIPAKEYTIEKAQKLLDEFRAKLDIAFEV